MKALFIFIGILLLAFNLSICQSTLTDQEIAEICNDPKKCEEFFLKWEEESINIAMAKGWDVFIRETRRIARLAGKHNLIEFSRSVMMGVYETQYMLRDYNGALKTVDSLLSLENLSNGNRQAFLYRAGTLRNFKEHYDVGIPMLLEAIEISPKDDSTFLPTIYSDLGHAYHKIGESQKAIDYLLQGLSMDNRPEQLATKYLVISHVYNSIGDFDKGEAYLEKSGLYYDKNRVSYYQTFLVQKAMIYLKKGEYKEAETIIDEVSAYVDTAKIQKPDHFYLLVKAEIQANQGDFTNLRSTLEKIDTSTFYQSFKKHYYAHMWSLYYTGTNDLVSAQNHMKAYSKLIEPSFNSSAIQDYLASNIKLERKLGNYKKALEFTNRYHHRADSIYRSGQENYVLELGEKYESETKQLEIERLNAQNQVAQLELGRRNRMLLFGGVLLTLASVFSFFLYRLFERTRSSESALKKVNGELSESLQTNKALLKEIHHRVKNNLQVVSSLLTLQSKFVNDDTALAAINTGKSRVQSMSILHRNLYQNENLKSIKIKPYFNDLIENLVSTYQVDDKEISIASEVDDIELDVDTVIPMGLITNELISNSLKYAFEGKVSGTINLKIKKQGDTLELNVKDDGIGVPFTKIPKRSKTLGMQLIHSFTKKLKGEIQIMNGAGTEINITMPASGV
ncbi:MAG: histidine kinase dimerization/phosphoacceptor domain -containing protein [Bacteroidota bacterium]